MAGKLYLIPSSLGDNTVHSIPQHTVEVAHSLDIFIAERAKTARHFLKALQTPVAFNDMTFYELNKKTPPEDVAHFLKDAENGKNVGLLSEAGCPGVADPGAVIVQLAHQKGIEVIPLVGPSSILLALMASGMNGQSFAFVGYLGVKKGDRIRDLKRLEQLARKLNQTQIFIETPYRNMSLIEDMLTGLSPRTRLCIAANLTLPTEYIKTKTIQEWKKTKLPELHKQPAIFLIL
ncbi:MAG: SAM-dependent methyltransferase [Saprospiraceae bacterium]